MDFRLCRSRDCDDAGGFGYHAASPQHLYDSAAVANLRTISTAEVTYLSSSGGRYGTMEDLIDARLVDDTFTGTKAGYRYTIMLNATGSGFTAEALPASKETGRYGYYTLPDAVIRYSTHVSLSPAGRSGHSVQ